MIVDQTHANVHNKLVKGSLALQCRMICRVTCATVVPGLGTAWRAAVGWLAIDEGTAVTPASENDNGQKEALHLIRTGRLSDSHVR